MEDALPREMWEAYCKKAGGVTFDGKPLPTWDDLGADRRACWQAAADAARSYLSPSA